MLGSSGTGSVVEDVGSYMSMSKARLYKSKLDGCYGRMCMRQVVNTVFSEVTAIPRQLRVLRRKSALIGHAQTVES
jgi:hypothetical protein